MNLYVSKSGDNSDGSSWAKAFHSIQQALLAVPDAQGGHRVSIRPDTYGEANLSPAYPGAAGAYNELVGDHDGALGSGATGRIILDASEAERGFDSRDGQGVMRVCRAKIPPDHTDAAGAGVGWDRWLIRRVYATGGDTGLFWNLADKPLAFTVVVEDCVGIGRAFGGGVANHFARRDEPVVFRRCKFHNLDWRAEAGDTYITGAAAVRGANLSLPEDPDAILEDCVLVSPDNALQSGYPYLNESSTRVRLKNCALIVLNFSQAVYPEVGVSTGIVRCDANQGSQLHVDFEDCRLMGYKVFGARNGEVSYALRGKVQAYLQFTQPTPPGFERLGLWPKELIAEIGSALPVQPLHARQIGVRSLHEPAVGQTTTLPPTPPEEGSGLRFPLLGRGQGRVPSVHGPNALRCRDGKAASHEPADVQTSEPTRPASSPLPFDPSAPTYTGRKGSVLYVSKRGDNSDGSSWQKAWHTIQAALSAVPDDQGGHRIVVRPDTYLEIGLVPTHKGAAGAYNQLIGDVDGALGSGATGWVVIDCGDPQRGFKSTDYNCLFGQWATLQDQSLGDRYRSILADPNLPDQERQWVAAQLAAIQQHPKPDLPTDTWDRWMIGHVYAAGANCMLWIDQERENQSGPCSMVIHDCVAFGQATGAGGAWFVGRPDEPLLFRRCYFMSLDWFGDCGAAYVRAEHTSMPDYPDAVFEDCTLVSPDNALQTFSPGCDKTFTRVRLQDCLLVALNFSPARHHPLRRTNITTNEPSGIICCAALEGNHLHIDFQDCRLVGGQVFTTRSGRVSYTTTGRVQAYLERDQPVPNGFERLGRWPAPWFDDIVPPPEPGASSRG